MRGHQSRDEFGYLPADPEIGPLLYEVIATRYEKKATIVTSNKSLTEWGRVLHDSALAAALVDRLMHHGDVYYLKGESYRVRGKERTELPSPPRQRVRIPTDPQEADGTFSMRTPASPLHIDDENLHRRRMPFAHVAVEELEDAADAWAARGALALAATRPRLVGRSRSPSRADDLRPASPPRPATSPLGVFLRPDGNNGNGPDTIHTRLIALELCFAAAASTLLGAGPTIRVGSPAPHAVVTDYQVVVRGSVDVAPILRVEVRVGGPSDRRDRARAVRQALQEAARNRRDAATLPRRANELASAT